MDDQDQPRPTPARTLDAVLAVTEAGAAAFWVGASAGFAFLTAPSVARTVTDLDRFADVIDLTIGRTTSAARVGIAVAVAAALLRSAGASDDARANDLVRALCGAGAAALLTYHQQRIVPTMGATRRALGSFRDAPETDPRRIAYRAEHKRSTRVYGAALLLGIAAIGLGATRSLER